MFPLHEITPVQIFGALDLEFEAAALLLELPTENNLHVRQEYMKTADTHTHSARITLVNRGECFFGTKT